MSYHDVFITTAEIERTSIFDLPFGIELTCNRVGGWTLWRGDTQLAGEYAGEQSWLVIDVAGHVVLDSREDYQGRTDSMRCDLCGEQSPDTEALEHLRLMHPEQYGEGPALWPDGSLVIVDTTLEPGDFTEGPTA